MRALGPKMRGRMLEEICPNGTDGYLTYATGMPASAS